MQSTLNSSDTRWRLSWPCVFLMLGVLALVNVATDVFHLSELGDGKLIALLIVAYEQLPTAKYVIGMSALHELYVHIWQAPALNKILPLTMTGAVNFVRVTGIIVMTLCSIMILLWQRSRLRVVLVCTTPVWLLFGAGYIEYYPFIAGAMLALLCWLFAQPLEQRPASMVGIVCTAMPLLYAGFVPYSGIIMLAYIVGAGWRRGAIAVVYAAVAFVLLLVIFWPGSPLHFLTSLLNDLNLGEKNIVYQNYQGHSAGEYSIFFSPVYVFSLAHANDVLTMLLSGAGGVSLVLLPLTIWRHSAALRRGSTINQLLAVLLLAWSVIYLVFTIPKLGPARDFDLFFVSYLSFAFLTGIIAETWKRRSRLWLLGCWLASSCVALLHVVSMAPSA